MSDEQMDEFLESIGGLENGYFTDREPITSCGFFECNNGWFPLIKELMEDIIVLGWDRKTCQVKEKFGTLRIYYSGGDDYIRGLVSMAQAMSGSTCEVCGNTGKFRGKSWFYTSCDEHNLKGE